MQSEIENRVEEQKHFHKMEALPLWGLWLHNMGLLECFQKRRVALCSDNSWGPEPRHAQGRTHTHTHTQSLEISSVWHTDTINQLISLLLTVPRRLLLLIFRWCVTLAFVSLSYFTRPFPCSFFQPQVWPLSPYPFSFCAFIPYSCLCPYHHHHSFHFYRHLKKIPQITRHLSPPPHKNSVILAPKWIRQHKMIPSFWGINQGMGRGIIAQKLMHISYLLWYTFWSMHNVVTV